MTIKSCLALTLRGTPVDSMTCPSPFQRTKGLARHSESLGAEGQVMPPNTQGTKSLLQLRPALPPWPLHTRSR